MHPQNSIPRSVTLAILSTSLFAYTSLVAEEKRKIDLEKDKVYEHVIKPILSANCTTCHGSSKSKGKIRLHNPEEIKKSESVVAGKVDESMMIERILLPEDDEEVMPPEGKKRLSSEQKKMLSWWIAEGANFEKTNFTSANLTRANFTGASLIETNFQNSNLVEANFISANFPRPPDCFLYTSL